MRLAFSEGRKDEPATQTMQSLSSLENLTRHELQVLAKSLGIRANQKSSDLISQILEIQSSSSSPITAKLNDSFQSLNINRQQQLIGSPKVSAPQRPYSVVAIPSTPARPTSSGRKSTLQEAMIEERRRRRQSIQVVKENNLWERVESTSKPGAFYFYNRNTGETCWEPV